MIKVDKKLCEEKGLVEKESIKQLYPGLIWIGKIEYKIDFGNLYILSNDDILVLGASVVNGWLDDFDIMLKFNNPNIDVYVDSTNISYCVSDSDYILTTVKEVVVNISDYDYSNDYCTIIPKIIPSDWIGTSDTTTWWNNTKFTTTSIDSAGTTKLSDEVYCKSSI